MRKIEETTKNSFYLSSIMQELGISHQVSPRLFSNEDHSQICGINGLIVDSTETGNFLGSGIQHPAVPSLRDEGGNRAVFDAPKFLPKLKKVEKEDFFNIDTDAVFEDESGRPSAQIPYMNALVKKEPGFFSKFLEKSKKTQKSNPLKRGATEASLAPTTISFKVLNPRFPALNKLKESNAQIDAMNQKSKMTKNRRKLTKKWQKEKKKRTVIIMDTSEVFGNSRRNKIDGVCKEFLAKRIAQQKAQNLHNLENFGLEGENDKKFDFKKIENLKNEKSRFEAQMLRSTGITEKAEPTSPSCAETPRNFVTKSKISRIGDLLKQRKIGMKNGRKGMNHQEASKAQAGRQSSTQKPKIRSQSKKINYTEYTDLTPLMESQSSFSDEILKKMETLAFGKVPRGLDAEKKRQISYH